MMCAASLLFAVGAAGFSFGARPGSLSLRAAQQSARSLPPRAVVLEISSQEEFDKALGSAGESLVVIDYSTSWCGPCKIIAPKFDEFSEQYKNVAFLKVMGDSSPEADKLMRSQVCLSPKLPFSPHMRSSGQPCTLRSPLCTSPLISTLLRAVYPFLIAILCLAFATQGVRALPSFHFWKANKQVDSISGAKAQTLQDAIETHMN